MAVISGGASGIGLAAAKYYLSQGMKVAIGDKDEGSLKSAADQLSGQKDNVFTGSVDVSNQESVSTFRSSVTEVFLGAKVSVLMANAGVSGATKATSSEGWERILHTNFFGVVNV